ncbi:MAG TPA: exonuclease subunit SbcD [Gemmataceae bacterium]|jgi:exonuclease SbcD|nr:exonuclease subunit SbcD [Gemmataceae bacterium]
MRILHTADWHLGDRLGRIDRTGDLRVAVERVGDYCRQENVDVLLVAGDLFSELARPDGLRETIEHWQTVFRDFLAGGGTILTLTGNHDNENFCRTLSHAMNLAAPTAGAMGELAPPGRLYLATEPTLLRLRDRRESFDVQFVLMPYPTPARYLRDNSMQRFTSPEEKNQRLMTAFREALHTIRQHERFDNACPTVLAAHVNVSGATVGPALFRIAETEDVVIAADDMPTDFAYVALGHIHKPQSLGGREHVRYSGSIERMDLGEANDDKSVVVFDVGPAGLVGMPRVLPLPSTPIYEIDIRTPATDLPELKERYADAEQDLVNLHIHYTAGTDSLEEVLREAEAIFPRYYTRDWNEASALGPALQVGGPSNSGKGFEETVRDYVQTELMNHTDEEQAELIARLDALFAEE